jgi:hypothetical protein
MIDRICNELQATAILPNILLRQFRSNIQLPTAQAVPSVPAQIRTRTGPRFPTLPNDEEYKTVSLSATIVRTAITSCRRAGLTLSTGKKLKKRLEDLERRAGSSSASPEQRHEELATPSGSPSSQPAQPAQLATQRQRSSSSQTRRDRTPEVFHQQYTLPSVDDPGMFSQHNTRQMSTSPPPFSYNAISAADSVSYSSYAQMPAYSSMPVEMPLYSHYYQHTPHNNYQHIVPTMASPPVKQEYYNEESDMNPFSMSFASLGGSGATSLDVSAANSYQDSVASYVSTRPPPIPRFHSYPQWPTNSG